jgi:glycosyltransferase involved in cell wall biosynthesis
MLEAMAAGLPILATDIPAHRDMLEHRQTGWLAGTRSDLAEGLSWLEDPLHNVAIGQAARQRIKDTVGTWDDCAGRYAAAYRDLLALEPSA